MTANTAIFPKVSRFAKIDVKEYIRQDWRHAFHLELPQTIRTKYSDIVDISLNPTNMTILIPYLQSKDNSKPSAVFITPTLGGGKHIEDRGRIKETITLTGTSGFLAAFKPTGTLFEQFKAEVQREIASFTLEGELTEKGKRSGYAWFHRFMNVFELYWKIKREEDPHLAEATRLIWVGEKDEEFLVVSPLSFNYRRGNSGLEKFAYSWTIQLEVIESFDKNPLKPRSPLISPSKSIFELFAEVFDAIAKIIEIFVELVKLTFGLVATLIQSVLDLFRIAYDLIDNLRKGIVSIANTFYETGASIVKSIFDTGRAAIQTIQDFYNIGSSIEKAFNEALVTGGQAVEAFFAKAREFSGQLYPEKRISEDTKYGGSRPVPGGSPALLANSIRESTTGPDYTEELDVDSIGSSPYSSGLPLINSRAGNPSAKGLKSYEGDLRQFSRDKWTDIAVRQIHQNDTIFSIAKRELGSIHYWQDLVILNNLNPPYIVADNTTRSSGVLTYNDKIRVPLPASSEVSIERSTTQIISKPPQVSGIATGGTVTTLIDATKSAVPDRWRVDQWKGFTCSIISGTNSGEKSLISSNTFDTITVEDAFTNPIDGTSVYIIWLDQINPPMPDSNDDMSLGFDLEGRKLEDGRWDMVKAPNNDASVITGIRAFVQSMHLGFDTRLGADPWRPEDGLYNIIGMKATTENLLLHRLYARQIVLSDERVDEIVHETVFVDESSDISRIEMECVLVGGFKARVSAGR